MMFASIDPWIFGFSAVTVVATIWMGFWAARKSKTASDFFVAGRSVSVGWNASAISGEYLSAASFMGVAGMVMAVGYDALWYPVCYACGYLFLLLFIAGPLRRFGAYTVPDLAEGRFDSPVFRKIAVVFVLFIGFFYTMPQMKGAGTTLAYIFPGLPYWAGVVLVGAVITLNVALGGMKGITLVQAFQYWAKMFAISVPIFVLMAVYGNYGKQLGANVNSADSASEFRDGIEWITVVQGPTALQKIADQAEDLWGQHVTGSRGTNREAGQAAETNSIFRLLKGYADVRSCTVLRTSELEDAIIKVPTNIVPIAEYPELIEAALKTAGVVLVSEPGNTVKAAPVGLLVSSRKPLPKKAPADSTWLSPFGPLTTKAAKNAAVAYGKSQANNAIPAGTWRDVSGATNLVSVSTSISLPAVNGWVTLSPPPGLARAEDRLRAMFGQARHYSVGNPKLVSVLMDYGRLSGQTVVVHTNVGLTRLLGSLELDWNQPAVLLTRMEQFLGTNGVVLRQESDETFRAMTSEQGTLWDGSEVQKATSSAAAAAEKAWLAKHEKPLALLYTYSLIIALVCGTAGLPHILVRFYTNPDGVAAKRTTMWVMILIGIFYVFPPVFGVMGRNLFPELYSGIGAKGTDKIVLELPRLLNEKYAPLGSILSGITCAGAFAAFMSTFSGLLVSMTGAMAHDVYGRMINPRATAEQRLRAFKIAAVGVGGVAILLGTMVEPLQINFMVGQAFAIAAASYFPLLFMCAWWRNLTMKGAATGMLTGGLAAVFAISLTSFSDLAKATDKTAEFFAVFKPMNEFWAAHPLLRILCEQPAIWAVPLAIGLMVVVSKLTRSEVPSDIRMKMLVLHAPEKLGLKQEYIQEHQHGH